MPFLSIIAGLVSCAVTAVADSLTAVFGVGQRLFGLRRARLSPGPIRYRRSTRLAIRTPIGG